MTVRRVLIVGNSVSMSSDHVAGYPERIAPRAAGWDVKTIIHSGATIEEMEPEVTGALRAERPEALVLQVGINECAPRPLGVDGRNRLGTLRPVWLRERIIWGLHRWRQDIIRLRGVIQFTPPDRFAAAVLHVLGAARSVNARVLLLPITRVTAIAEARTPFTNREVARYNEILGTLAAGGAAWMTEDQLLGGMTPADYCVTPESVHLSDAAHERVAAAVAGWLASLSQPNVIREVQVGGDA
jgi:hypothetical protein